MGPEISPKGKVACRASWNNPINSLLGRARHHLHRDAATHSLPPAHQAPTARLWPDIVAAKRNTSATRAVWLDLSASSTVFAAACHNS